MTLTPTQLREQANTITGNDHFSRGERKRLTDAADKMEKIDRIQLAPPLDKLTRAHPPELSETERTQAKAHIAEAEQGARVALLRADGGSAAIVQELPAPEVEEDRDPAAAPEPAPRKGRTDITDPAIVAKAAAGRAKYWEDVHAGRRERRARRNPKDKAATKQKPAPATAGPTGQSEPDLDALGAELAAEAFEQETAERSAPAAPAAEAALPIGELGERHLEVYIGPHRGAEVERLKGELLRLEDRITAGHRQIEMLRRAAEWTHLTSGELVTSLRKLLAGVVL